MLFVFLRSIGHEFIFIKWSFNYDVSHFDIYHVELFLIEIEIISYHEIFHVFFVKELNFMFVRFLVIK